jgi:hypothetical protein
VSICSGSLEGIFSATGRSTCSITSARALPIPAAMLRYHVSSPRTFQDPLTTGLSTPLDFRASHGFSSNVANSVSAFGFPFCEAFTAAAVTACTWLVGVSHPSHSACGTSASRPRSVRFDPFSDWYKLHRLVSCGTPHATWAIGLGPAPGRPLLAVPAWAAGTTRTRAVPAAASIATTHRLMYRRAKVLILPIRKRFITR